MVTKQQPSREDILRAQNAQNQQFMSLSYSQPIKGNAQNGTGYGQGKTLVTYAPVIQGAWAHAITLRYNLEIEVKGTGTVKPNAGYPENLVRELRVDFGNKVIQASPVIARVIDKMEGYARTLQSSTTGFKNAEIEALLNQVPTNLTAGKHTIHFDVTLDLNQLHPASVNGILPIFGNGTYLQTTLTLPSSVIGNDPMDNVFKVTGDNTTVDVNGDVEVFYHFRNHISMSTTQAIQPSIDGLPSVQIIQLPSVSPLVAQTWNAQNFRNPYALAKCVNFLIDGLQSDAFSKPSNVLGYALDQAENPNSAFIEYSEQTGGMSMYYKEIRARFGQDIEEAIIFDATTQNVANVSAKQGTAYLNLTGQGYVSGRQRYKVGRVGDGSNGISPRVVSYAVILNEDPVKAR